MSWCARKGRGDAHKIMRQITGRETCISSSALPLHVTPCQRAILRYSLSCDAQNHRPASGRKEEEEKKTLSRLFSFFGRQLPWLQSMSERRWRGEDSLDRKARNLGILSEVKRKNYLFLRSPLRKWVLGCFPPQQLISECGSLFKNTAGSLTCGNEWSRAWGCKINALKPG